MEDDTIQMNPPNEKGERDFKTCNSDMSAERLLIARAKIEASERTFASRVFALHLIDMVESDRHVIEGLIKAILDHQKASNSERRGTNVAMLTEQNEHMKAYLRIHNEYERLKLVQQEEAQRKPKPIEEIKERTKQIRAHKRAKDDLWISHIQWLLVRDPVFEPKPHTVRTLNPGSEFAKEKAKELNTASRESFEKEYPVTFVEN